MTKKFDPFRHHRRSIRYADWDYRTPGYYFVTICTHQRENLFYDSGFKSVVENGWRKISTINGAKHVVLDEWIVMPNHLHGILWLQTWPESIQDEPIKQKGFSHAQSGSVGVIVGNFKSQSSRRINNLRKTPKAPVWQLGYWDRIVRTEEELNNIRQYIINNPIRWQEEKENLDNLFIKMTYHP